jgi:hypothetical protein
MELITQETELLCCSDLRGFHSIRQLAVLEEGRSRRTAPFEQILRIDLVGKAKVTVQRLV